MNAIFDTTEFVGARTSLRSACERADAAVACSSPIYLWGASGVGKETFAKAIASSGLAKLRVGTLKPQHWNALTSDETAEEVLSALAPNGERIYFTEIEALPKPTQRKLALRARDWSRRVIFASTRSFLSCREEGIWDPEFEELLTGFPICLPDLKARRGDIPELANLFLRQEANALGVWKRELTGRELDSIEKMDFPNNLDDLRIVAAKLAAGAPEPFNLDSKIGGPEPKQSPRPESRSLRSALLENGLDAIELTPENFPSLEEAAVKHIEAALKLTNGVVEGKNGAAALLKINPYTLRSRMRKMKVDWTRFRDE